MKTRSFGLLAALALAASVPMLAHCAATDAEPEGSEDDIVGPSNAMGLGLRYDERSGTLQATLKRPLGEGEELRVRLRAGSITLKSEKELRCDELSPMTSIALAEAGKFVFDGPKVDRSLFDLLKLYDDPRWGTNEVTAQQRELAKAPNAIVEACVVKGGKAKAKLQTNLAYALDLGTKAQGSLGTKCAGINLAAADGGLAAADGGSDGGASQGNGGSAEEPRVITEENVRSMIEYGQLCEAELGDIPFFPRIGEGKYETFNCRDLVANGQNDLSPHAVAGVEGNGIPAYVDGHAVETCSAGRELNEGSDSYGCLEKADNSMFLHPGDNQPGPMVVTAKNAKGTHWALLCRAVADDGSGMMKTKRFNDIAMLGHNPKTGRTCFFQNSLGGKDNGGAVPHPGDIGRSSTLWSDQVQTYCSGSCHGNSPFVHSPWIDGAKRKDGKTVVPRMGEHPDLHISNAAAPYNIVAANHLGFAIPKILVSEEASACTNCHTLARGRTMDDFTKWATGTGGEDSYSRNLTETGKQFKNSHWMPMNLEGLDANNFSTSKYGKALEFIKKCNNNPMDPACEWADSPRGSHENPKLVP
jgi:hypothetical protein